MRHFSFLFFRSFFLNLLLGKSSLKSEMFSKSKLVTATDFIPPASNIDLHGSQSEPSIKFTRPEDLACSL